MLVFKGICLDFESMNKAVAINHFVTWDCFKQGFRYTLFFFVFMVLAGCATSKLDQSISAFYNNQPEKAEALLSGQGYFSKRDRLLFLMEKGMVLHHLGHYESSTKELRNASLLMEKQEAISIVRQTSSLITTEWITEYKGEYSERLWVHTYLMINYLLLHKYEDALVEAKQALRIFEEHPASFKEAYFTRALIALCFDNLNELNGAYIEYKKLSELLPDPAPVAADLYRLATELGFSDEAERYKKYAPSGKGNFFDNQPQSELVLFVGLGRSPSKVPVNIVLPPSIRFSFVRYENRTGEQLQVEMLGAEKHLPVASITSDIGKVARASLEERKRRIMAKETARVAAKEALAQTVRKNSGELAEILVRGVLFVTEEPDTRSWQTLPAFLTLLRIPLAPGRHDIDVAIMGKMGGVRKRLSFSNLNVSDGQRIFRSVRY
jgi:hypothetical protein